MEQGIVTIGDNTWYVSIATTPLELARGLGGVASIAPGTGMLFDTGWEHFISVTTEPMIFPIDIVWISSTLSAADLIREVEPNQILTSDSPCRYFLEVNAGETEGIEIGDQVSVLILSRASQQDAIATFAASTITLGFVAGLAKSIISSTLPQTTECFADTEHTVGQSMIFCQTDLDDSFREAIRRAKALYGVVKEFIS
jgi:uncharacterized membrane protein (UPF0127 family)